ncbi:MAG: hypothetical protein ABIG39_07515 [Candidatus Micrarchaeota archaeon]
MKLTHLLIVLVLGLGLFGCTQLTETTEEDFVGEKVVSIKTAEVSDIYGECKRICEETSKKKCYDLFEICRQGGASGIFGCNEYLEQNPDVLDKYPCTYYIGQSVEGSDSMPCSFSCK